MDKIYRVFISSTYEDLIEERREVTQALLEMDCFPTGMELFQASNDSQWELIKKVINTCDYYIVIVAGRYGSIHEELQKSYTQMEYEFALEAGIPILGFVRKDIERLPANQVDRLDRVKEFIKIVERKEVRHWSTPHELAGMVSRAMHRIMKENPRTGWVRNADLIQEMEVIEAFKKIMVNQDTVEKIIGRQANTMWQPPTGPEEGLSLVRKESTKLESQVTDKPRQRLEKGLSDTSTISNIPSGYVEYTKSLYLDVIRIDALKEFINIALSSGITAFSYLFDETFTAGLPVLNFFENLDNLTSLFNEGSRTSAFFDFWGSHVSGCIVVSMGNHFLRNTYIRHVRECSLRISSRREINAYKNSMYSEFGSIFSGSCATAICDFAAGPIQIQETSLQQLRGSILDENMPVYVGSLPFVMTNNTYFSSYLLLDADSAKNVLASQEKYFR